MLDALRFVQGAITRRQLIPELSHFKIENGLIRSFNGSMALASPIPLDFNCIPKARAMIRAIENCKNDAELSLTKAGRLKVQSGKFRAYIETLSEEIPTVAPEGEVLEIDGEKLLETFNLLHPFIGTDAVRTWTKGIMLRGESAYATNNICIVEYWTGTKFPKTINVPASAVHEVIRIGLPPSHIQTNDRSIAFHYESGRWLRSQLYEINWPDFEHLFGDGKNAIPVPQDFFLGIKKIQSFVEEGGRVYIKDGSVSTHNADDVGAIFEVEGLDFIGCYNIEMLMLLESVAVSIDFSHYPDKCFFYGKNLRGTIIGMAM